MPDAPLGLVAKPITVCTNIRCQPLSARPVPDLRASQTWKDRNPVSKTRWNLDLSLVDQYGHRVEVGGIGLKPEPLSLEGNTAAARERVDNRRRHPSGGLHDLRPHVREKALVSQVLPDDHALNEAM